MNRILITGGAGFIGSHTCLALLEKGYDLIVIDSFINSSRKSLLRVKEILKLKVKDLENKLCIVHGDLRDRKILESTFIEAKKCNKPINSVIHFAGLKSVEKSFDYSLDYWETNVLGTINLLNVMRNNNCKTIVFSSTAAIYKVLDNKLLNESSEIKPLNPYGLTKFTVEKILKDLFVSDKNSWRIACLRYFNPIGAHSSGLIGEYSKGVPSNVFPYINLVANKKIEYLKIYGNSWPTTDGTGIRDYIHVMDLAEGHIHILEFLNQNNIQFLTLNLGTGIGTSVLQLVNTFKKVNRVDIPYIFTDKRKGDLGTVVADCTLVNKLTKWRAKRNLEDMCRDGWNWQVNNPNGY